MRLIASLHVGSLRIAVSDGGIEGYVAVRAHQERDNVGGFGLELVTRLASAWGVERDDRGTTVWLEIATPAQTTS
jgi:hypothetical protein